MAHSRRWSRLRALAHGITLLRCTPVGHAIDRGSIAMPFKPIRRYVGSVRWQWVFVDTGPAGTRVDRDRESQSPIWCSYQDSSIGTRHRAGGDHRRAMRHLQQAACLRSQSTRRTGSRVLSERRHAACCRWWRGSTVIAASSMSSADGRVGMSTRSATGLAFSMDSKSAGPESTNTHCQRARVNLISGWASNGT